MRRGRPGSGPISLRAMPTAYARWILSTQSRSTLKMKRFEPSIDLVFWGRYGVENGLPLWLGPLAASFGDLWRPLWACIMYQLFSLLSSLCCLPSSLAAARFSGRASHLSLRPLHQAIEPAPNNLDPLRHHPWPRGMREAIKYCAPPASAEPC